MKNRLSSKNPTKLPKYIVNAVCDVKPCSLIEIKILKLYLIEIKKNYNSETDLVSVGYKYSEIVKCFPKLSEIGESNKPHRHTYLEIVKVYLNSLYSAKHANNGENRN